MSQTQMISLRGKAMALKSRDEMIRDILIALMIALAVSLILCYLPMILDATQKASTSNDSAIKKVINDLSKGAYDEMVGIATPVATVMLGACAVLHFGYPGSKLDRMLQGWPMRIIIAFCAIALAPTILVWLETTLTKNGLFTWKAK